MQAEAALETADPWSHRRGWRMHGGARRRFELARGEQRHTVWLERQHQGGAVLQIGEQRWPCSMRALGQGRHDVSLADQRTVLTVYAQGEQYAVFAAQGSTLITEFDPIAHAGDHAHEGGRLTAPMPGKVVAFLAQPGDKVRQGQALAVMEAMKMEHTISAPRDGVVAELLYGVGDQVAEGGELLRLEAA
jgi:3-methylcrotonyl-CoA carboxylase alpha subunit